MTRKQLVFITLLTSFILIGLVCIKQTDYLETKTVSLSSKDGVALITDVTLVYNKNKLYITIPSLKSFVVTKETVSDISFAVIGKKNEELYTVTQALDVTPAEILDPESNTFETIVPHNQTISLRIGYKEKDTAFTFQDVTIDLSK